MITPGHRGGQDFPVTGTCVQFIALFTRWWATGVAAGRGRAGAGISGRMKLLPRRLTTLTTLTLALAAVPGPAAHAVNPGGPIIDGTRPVGWVQDDVSSPAVRAAAGFALTTLGEIFAHTYVVENIDSAQSQFVGSAQSQATAGTNVRLQFRIAQLDDGILGARKDCSADVFTPTGTQPQDQLTSFTCQSIDTPATAEVPV